MARRFSLATLLGLRHAQQDAAAAELALANAERQKAALRRAATEKMLSGVEFPLTEQTASAFAAMAASRAAMSARLTDHAALDELAAADAEAARERWVDAKTATSALDKLEARHLREERAREGREEQLILDEMASRAATVTAEPEQAQP